MPYINKDKRQKLNNAISSLYVSLKSNIDSDDNPYNITNLSNTELLGIAGDLNYSISKLCAMLAKDISYSKIAIITGVLENVKQEFYRRLAIPYEDAKIKENGDLTEFN